MFKKEEGLLGSLSSTRILMCAPDVPSAPSVPSLCRGQEESHEWDVTLKGREAGTGRQEWEQGRVLVTVIIHDYWAGLCSQCSV